LQAKLFFFQIFISVEFSLFSRGESDIGNFSKNAPGNSHFSCNFAKRNSPQEIVGDPSGTPQMTCSCNHSFTKWVRQDAILKTQQRNKGIVAASEENGRHTLVALSLHKSVFPNALRRVVPNRPGPSGCISSTFHGVGIRVGHPCLPNRPS
jgi:hypothetical protein